MSRAYKCDKCGGLFEGEPLTDSIPVIAEGKTYAYVDFVTPGDLCHDCRMKILDSAVSIAREVAKGATQDGG
jgi:DNA-directed RNA polymerase subunit RPC12/RpoP